MGDLENFLGFIVVLLGAAVIITIIDKATNSKKYQCPNCGAIVPQGVNPCPNCKRPLRWL
jgi:hypothetical protein